jgi:hypothetical protein
MFTLELNGFRRACTRTSVRTRAHTLTLHASARVCTRTHQTDTLRYGECVRAHGTAASTRLENSFVRPAAPRGRTDL